MHPTNATLTPAVALAIAKSTTFEADLIPARVYHGPRPSLRDKFVTA
jgi:hypothetical protein